MNKITPEQYTKILAIGLIGVTLLAGMIIVFGIVSNVMTNISDKFNYLISHNTNTTTIIINSTKTIIINSTKSSLIYPPAYPTNIQSFGNRTCVGPYLSSNSFIFNMTATIHNTTPNTITVEVLFQLDNATRADKIYSIPINSSINVSHYQTYNYCQFSGNQDFEIVLIYSTSVRRSEETYTIR